jgi:hypothetical protein
MSAASCNEIVCGSRSAALAGTTIRSASAPIAVMR